MARDNWLNKKIQVRPRFLLLLAIPVLLLVLAICKANARIGELQTQVDRAQEQVLAAYSETEELQRKLEFMDTDEYIEQEARKRYNLLGDREIRFVLGTENSDNTEKLLQGIKPETEKYDDVGDDTLEQPVPTAAPGCDWNRFKLNKDAGGGNRRRDDCAASPFARGYAAVFVAGKRRAVRRADDGDGGRGGHVLPAGARGGLRGDSPVRHQRCARCEKRRGVC